MLLFQLLGLLFYAVQEGNLYRGDVISVKAFVFLVFGFGLLFSQGVTYAACVLQYLTVRHLEVVVQTGNPVFHEHGLSAKRLQFRKIQMDKKHEQDFADLEVKRLCGVFGTPIPALPLERDKALDKVKEPPRTSRSLEREER